MEEMFRLALTYTPGSATYNKIFMTAVQLFPDNPTANLNAACIALIQKDTKTAAVFLEKAPPLPETTLAKGVCKATIKKQRHYSGSRKTQDCYKPTIT